MATKLKAVKCPQCGSEKHEQIDEKRYKCLNCGTEFFLDDDDININVNHHYEFQSSPFDTTLGTGVKLGAVALLIPLLVVFIFVFFLFRTGSSGDSSILTKEDSVSVRDSYIEVVPMVHNGKPCLFYVTDRDYTVRYGQDKSKYVDGYYFGFRDAVTGKVLAERLFMSEDDARNESVSSLTGISYLNQARHWYIIMGKRYVFQVDAKSLTVKDVSKSFFDGKQAMSTGISSISFIDKDYGEGFEVQNNLAQTYFYFPASNRLYSEDAFKFAKNLPPSELNGEVRDTIFQEIHKKDAGSSGKGGLLRLWKVHAKYHLGDPQDFSFYSWMTNDYYSQNRLVSATPVTEWFVGFDGGIVYQDALRVLIEYYPSMAPGVNSVFQLRNMDGNVVWTQVLKRFSEVSVGALCGNKIWFLGKRDRREGYDDIHAYSIDINTGHWEQGAQLRHEYSIKFD